MTVAVDLGLLDSHVRPIEMLLSQKSCPTCNGNHGHSAWRVASSSVAKPLRCKACSAYFHQTGLNIWFVAVLLFPVIGVYSVVAGLLKEGAIPLLAQWAHPVSFFAALLIYFVATAILVSRIRPLAIGPKHG
jgi:hypothetical protein